MKEAFLYFNIEFILENQRGRLPSRLFFTSMDRLGITVDKYLVPSNWKLSPEDIQLYTDAILYDLLHYVRSGGVKNMDYAYVRDVVAILKSWACKGHTISVL